MKDNKNKNKNYKINGLPRLSSIPKKDYDQFIALLEFQIRDFYKQNYIPP